MSGIERCESPMERRLAEAFVRFAKFEWRTDGDADCEIGRWSGWWIALLTQQQIGPYRCDFVLASCFPAHVDCPPWLIVVEVDGHDYHERTKQQAKRDKARDRFFQTKGGFVLRYTGSEVWHNAGECAAEALALAMRLQQPELDAAFARFIEEKHVTGQLATEPSVSEGNL